jgi:hypothetical protein
MYLVHLHTKSTPPQRQIAHIRIGFAFPAEIASFAVAGDKLNIVAKWPEFASDAVEQLLVIAFGKVGAADAAFEQEVTDKGDFRWPVDDCHVAWRMARAMDDLKNVARQLQRIAIIEIAGGQAIFIAAGLPIFGPLRHNIVKQPLVILVRPDDVHAIVARQFLRPACMIEVAMREPDRDDLDAHLLGRCQQTRHLATGINKHPLHRRLGPQQRGVLLEGCYRDDSGL